MNKQLIAFVLGAALVLGTTVVAQVTKYNSRFAENAQRACMLETGGWTVIDCSAGAAYSAQLTVEARYLFQSTADDTYLSFHSAGSGGNADANDMELDGGDIVDLIIDKGATYATCDGNAGGNSGKIKYIECK